MVQICESVTSCLLLLFLVFAHLLSQLRTLSIDATRIRELLLFYFLVTAFIVIIGLFLFLVVHLLSQLRMLIIEGPMIRRSPLFGAFIAP